MRDTRPILHAARLLGALAAASAVAGCQHPDNLPGNVNILDPAGPVAAGQRLIIINASIIMLAIILPVMVLTPLFAWWFRASNPRAHYRPDWAFSGRIELVVWTVPLLTILFLGGICWIGSHDLDPAKPIQSDRRTLEVQVVSLDWKWLFIYPEQNIAAINQLVVPVGTPIHFTLTSASVWNAFFVPRLGSMIYTMKGMTTQLHLQADEEGTFFGMSMQFSGDGYPDMGFNLRSVAGDEFDGWIRGARGTGAALDPPTYAELIKQSLGDPPRTFGSVDADLFRRIVALEAPQGPGPGGGAAARPEVRERGGNDHPAGGAEGEHSHAR